MGSEIQGQVRIYNSLFESLTEQVCFNCGNVPLVNHTNILTSKNVTNRLKLSVYVVFATINPTINEV